MMKCNIPPTAIKKWVADRFDYSERKDGMRLCIANPFKHDTKKHLEINLEIAAVHDWRGDEWVGNNPSTGKRNKCTFLRFVQMYLTAQNGHCSFLQAIQSILGSGYDKHVLTQQPVVEQPSESQITLPARFVDVDWDDQSHKTNPSLNYLRNRSIRDDVIRRHRIMTSPSEICFPYYEFDELVYWQSRSIISKRFEFPSSDVGITKSDFLYNYDQIEPNSYVIIVEAIIDCMSVGKQCVAIGGATISHNQILALKMLNPSDGIILAADADQAGRDSIITNGNMLNAAGFTNVYWCIPGDDDLELKDWNDMLCHTSNDIHKYIEKHVRPFDIRAKYRLSAKKTLTF